MNERIKELAEQAQYYAEYTTPQGLEWFDKFKEKFAELIVKEMLVTCEDHPAWTGRMIGEQIKQHFGVEDLPVCKHDWYSAKNPVVQNGSVCVICGAIDAREPEELKNE
jgi:hypothetical protein